MILTPEERRALLVLAVLLAFGQVLASWQRYRDAKPDRDLSAWLKKVAEARESGASDPQLAEHAASVFVPAFGSDPVDSSGVGRPGPQTVGARSEQSDPSVSSAPGKNSNERGAGGGSPTAEHDSGGHDAPSRAADGSTAKESREPAVRLQSAKHAPPGILEGGRLGIDVASKAELEALPGVGPALAGRILLERSARPFTKVEDLKRVKGIGPKTFERLLPWIQITGVSADTARHIAVP